MIPAICLLGFLGAVLLLLFADKVNPANRYLAYHFFLNALFGLAHWGTVISESETLRAIFTIHYFPFYLLNTPFLYFYVRAVLTGKIHIRGWDYVHFVPALAVFFNIVPYLLLPWHEKLNFVYILHKDYLQIYTVYFPFIPFAFYFVTRSIFSLGYIFASILLVKNAVKQGIQKVNQTLRAWLQVSLSLAAFFNLALLALVLISMFKNDYVLIMDEQGRGRAVLTFFMSALTLSIYFFPKVLYGLQLQTSNLLLDVIKRNEEITSISKSPEVSKIRLKQVGQLVRDHVIEKHYLQPGYAMSDLVKDIAVPEHVLTYYFNNHQGITFLKWKNQLRITEAIRLLKAGEAETNTLESVGKACGYKSRSNFIQAFKTQTGESPSVYLKKLS